MWDVLSALATHYIKLSLRLLLRTGLGSKISIEDIEDVLSY